jgi:hypothetical protein
MGRLAAIHQVSFKSHQIKPSSLEDALGRDLSRKQLLDTILTPSRRNTSPLWPSLKELITLVVRDRLCPHCGPLFPLFV